MANPSAMDPSMGCPSDLPREMGAPMAITLPYHPRMCWVFTGEASIAL